MHTDGADRLTESIWACGSLFVSKQVTAIFFMFVYVCALLSYTLKVQWIVQSMIWDEVAFSRPLHILQPPQQTNKQTNQTNSVQEPDKLDFWFSFVILTHAATFCRYHVTLIIPEHSRSYFRLFSSISLGNRIHPVLCVNLSTLYSNLCPELPCEDAALQ